jgi:hypothetical protein
LDAHPVPGPRESVVTTAPPWRTGVLDGVPGHLKIPMISKAANMTPKVFKSKGQSGSRNTTWQPLLVLGDLAKTCIYVHGLQFEMPLEHCFTTSRTIVIQVADRVAQNIAKVTKLTQKWLPGEVRHPPQINRISVLDALVSC